MATQARRRSTSSTRSVSDSSTFDLARLVDPLGPDAFRRDYWEKRPLVVQRQDPGYYRELLSLRDVDEILNTSHLRPGTIRLVRVGDERAAEALSGPPGGRLEAIYEHYRDGFTVVLQFLQERWPALTNLCRALASEFSADFQVNVYLTPPHEQGLRTHYDTHDVFVLQAEGSKHWRIYDSPIRLPLRAQPYSTETATPGELLHELELRAGDLIYIPRGFVHDAGTNDESSLHLTVGVHSVTWGSVILRAVQRAIEQDSSFRESLPAGFATDRVAQEQAIARLSDLLNAWRDQIDPASVIREEADQRLLGTAPILDGHLLDLEAEPHVTLDSPLYRRPGVPWQLASDEDHVSLFFHGKVVQMPSYVEADLRFICDADRFTGAELPGVLDEPGRLYLVRTLLREGFLTTHVAGSA